MVKVIVFCCGLIQFDYERIGNVLNKRVEGRGVEESNQEGAGYHSTSKEKEYKKLCVQACLQAMKLLENGGCAVDGVVSAIRCLENSALTNAGTGSNLTLEGTVECDSSIMDGEKLLYGAAGCISGVRNPIDVAHLLLQKQGEGKLSLGRIPPSVLVGKGAVQWASKHGLNISEQHDLITESSLSTYRSHKRKLEMHTNRKNKKRMKRVSSNGLKGSGSESDENSSVDLTTSSIDTEGMVAKDPTPSTQSTIHDTVGAVAMDCHGNLAAGVSSGGISLKQPGRIGPAATFGAGCWAYNWKSDNKPGVAIATSGSGEQLMYTLLARECASCLQNQDDATKGLLCGIKENFLDSEMLEKEDEKFVGVIALRQEKQDASDIVELLWGHTTDSMCVAFVTSSQLKPKVFMSRLEDSCVSGKSYCIEGQHVL